LIQNVVARRYADALLKAARESDQVDQVLSDWELVMSFLKQDPRLGEMLRHQRLSTCCKRDIVRELWGDRVSRLFLGFLELIIDKRRERYLADIYEVFTGKVRQLRNIAIAEVRTAFTLDEQSQSDLVKALSKLTGKQIELRVSVVPELIGGLAVKIGDRVIDGSAVKRLQLLGARLVGRSNGKLEVGT
jgi:F-type H+-transporting ATPase subunit delta